MGLIDEILTRLAPSEHPERGQLVGKGDHFPFKTQCSFKTLSGYAAEYRLTGCIRLREAYAGQDNRLWQKDYDRVVRAFNTQVFICVLGGSRCFVFEWAMISNELGSLQQPTVLLCQPEKEAGEIYLKPYRDPEEIIKETKELDYVTHGKALPWKVELEKVEWGVWDKTAIERNYSMMSSSPKVLETINKDTRYREYEDAVAVAAMNRRHEIEQKLIAGQTEQEHGGEQHGFSIKTTGAAGNLQISWKKKGSWRAAAVEWV